MKKQAITTKHLVLTALLAALTVAGSALRVTLPIDIGGNTSFHLGNIMCALSGLLLGPWLGGLASGLGSAIYDMTNPLYISECWITFLTVGTLGQEGDPALGDVQGIGHIVYGGAKTGCQTTQPGTQQQTAEGTHDVAQVEGCGAGDVDGQGDPQGGTGYGQRSHQRNKHDSSGGEKLFLFHFIASLGSDGLIITKPGIK